MTFPNLKYPILQAPMGSIDSTILAASVSNAGGMGSLALTWTEPDVAADRIRKLRAETANLFFVNFVLSFPPKALEAALEAGTPAVTFSWGQPARLVNRIHQFDAQVGVQVGTVDGAKQALDSEVDFIICQGVEAGGHVQSTTPLSELLPKVVEIASSVPVVATGGLTDGEDLAWALRQGDRAMMLGTRFVATIESNAHPLYKQALVEAKSTDSVYTLCFDGGWPYAAHRVLRNRTLNEWETAGCPPSGQRPGEAEVIAEGNSGVVIKRYDDAPPVTKMEGHILECCLYAGTGCGRIEDIPEAAVLLSELWSEYKALTRTDC